MNPLGIPFTAVILRPPTTSFCKGEVVIGKIINGRGDFRIRPFHAKTSLESTELGCEYQACLKIIPSFVAMPSPLDTSIFDEHRKHKGRHRLTANTCSKP